MLLARCGEEKKGKSKLAGSREKKEKRFKKKEKEKKVQSDLAITDKLKFWWTRYNGNPVLHVRYSKVRLYQVKSKFAVMRQLVVS